MELILLSTNVFLIEKTKRSMYSYEFHFVLSERFYGQETRGVVRYPTHALQGKEETMMHAFCSREYCVTKVKRTSNFLLVKNDQHVCLMINKRAASLTTPFTIVEWVPIASSITTEGCRPGDCRTYYRRVYVYSTSSLSTSESLLFCKLMIHATEWFPRSKTNVFKLPPGGKKENKENVEI